MELKIGVTFYDDHGDRELPTPEEVRRTRRTVTIRADDPALPELIDDALFYAHGNVDSDYRWLVQAARTLLLSLERQGVTVPNWDKYR
jgi:hypothetical protein